MSMIFMASRKRPKDRQTRQREQKVYKPSAEPQPPLISPDKAGYRPWTDSLCVCFCVLTIVAFRKYWVVVFLRKRKARERKGVENTRNSDVPSNQP